MGKISRQKPLRVRASLAYGAGLATAIGSAVSFLVMLTHFVSRKNTLCLIKPGKLHEKLREISVAGFSTFFIDVAMGILTVLCIQCGAGIATDYFHKLRCRKRRTNP